MARKEVPGGDVGRALLSARKPPPLDPQLIAIGGLLIDYAIILHEVLPARMEGLLRTRRIRKQDLELQRRTPRVRHQLEAETLAVEILERALRAPAQEPTS